MKFKDFRNRMQKHLFRYEEARRVAWESSSALLKVQLHQWVQNGDLVRISRGLYAFSGTTPTQSELARALYGPAYISLETALHYYGLLPDVVFATTLVTPRISRSFTTPWGQFIYHKIHSNYFWGFDPDTLLGEREKILVDYFYYHHKKSPPGPKLWDSMRWQNLTEINFEKAMEYAGRFQRKKKMLQYLNSLSEYGAKLGTT